MPDNWGGGFSSATGQKEYGGPQGDRMEDKDAFQDKVDKASEPYSAEDIFGRPEIRTPVLDENGVQVGYITDANPFGVGGAFLEVITKALGLPTPTVYTGDPKYNPSQFNLGDAYLGTDDKFSNNPAYEAYLKSQREKIQARLDRANAMADKQNELAEAFGFFNDDFYDDMGASFTDFQNTALQQGYDASLRGIMEGFKAQGLLKQADVDAAVGNLDSAKATEMERISQGAADYSQAKRDEVAAKQAKLGDQLSALAGGATDINTIKKQTDAINAFDFGKEIEKLKTPGSKTSMDFFTDFTQLAAPADPSINVQAESTTGIPQFGEITPITSGIRSPFDSKSIRVV
tara:strand:- start:645 stop:1682 length:1038 start_codon:yes stop_codon:yes gene_type:complete